MSKLKTIIDDMMIIMAAMVLGLGIQEMLIHFSRGISSFEMPWYIPLTIPITAFLCGIPSAFINDIDGLSKRQINFRLFLHFICLMLVVTIGGYVFGWYSSSLEYLVIMFVYVIIYMSVWLISWWLGKHDEIIINQALKEFQDKE